MQFANFHAHSNFSDGKEAPETYLKNAIKQGLRIYGFSDHAPLPIDNFGAMHMSQLPAYLSEIDRLKEAYSDRIQVYKSLEVDYISDVINIHSEHIQSAKLDYTIGAVHFIGYLENGLPWGFEGSKESFEKGLQEVFDGDIKASVKKYFACIREMVQHHCPNVIAHLDRLKKQNKEEKYFSENETWYQIEVLTTLEAISKTDAILEINTKGYYRNEIADMYPSDWVLEAAKDMGIPFLIGSDAHHPDDIVKGFRYAIRLLRRMGVRHTRIFNNYQWEDVSIKRPRAHLVS